MAWCRQATSHYLGQCWPRSMAPYGVTRPQRVDASIDNNSAWLQILACRRTRVRQSSQPMSTQICDAKRRQWTQRVKPIGLEALNKLWIRVVITWVTTRDTSNTNASCDCVGICSIGIPTMRWQVTWMYLHCKARYQELKPSRFTNQCLI